MIGTSPFVTPLLTLSGSTGVWNVGVFLYDVKYLFLHAMSRMTVLLLELLPHSPSILSRLFISGVSRYAPPHIPRMRIRNFLSVPFFAGIAIGVLSTGVAADMLGSAVFPDIQSGTYFDAPVGRLYGQGIIKGAGDGNFHPADYVTRADVAVMLDRALNGGAAIVQSSSSRSSSSESSSSSTSSSSSSSVSVSSVANVGVEGAFRFSTDKIAFPESATNVSMSVQRYGGTKGSVSVRFSTSDGTGKSGTRYNQATGILTFADGETTKIVTIKFINNLIAEPNETLNVTLSEPTGGAVVGTPATIVVTVLDNDGGGGNSTNSSSSASVAGTSSSAAGGNISFSAWGYAVDENAGSIAITVVRKGNTSAAVNVNYATSAGTANPGVQYTDTQGTLSFASGETSKTFSIQVTDNSSIDGNKTANLKLTGPTGGAVLDTPNAVPLTIIDSEANPTTGTGTLAFSADSYSVGERDGTATITVLRRTAFGSTVTVAYSTGDSTAISGSDYTSTSGTLSFGPGESSKVFTVPVAKDTMTEGEEKLNLYLGTITGNATLGVIPNALLKIND